jgi:abhydrolase domain-containing protein 17
MELEPKSDRKTQFLTGLNVFGLNVFGRKARWKYLLYRLGRLLLISYLTIAGYAYIFGDRSILPAPPSSYETLPGLLQLTTPNQQTIAALYLPNPTAKYTLLMSHGNGEDLGEIRSQMEAFKAMGLSVFAYDYRGYGKSQGSASVGNVYDDIETAYGYLTQTLKIPPDRILLFGRSVGGGPSTYLASRQPIAGMILQSTFISTFRVVIPIQILPIEKFPNQEHLRKTRAPLLLIHGTDDRVIPYWHSQVLYQTAQGPKQFFTVEGADHNDVSIVAGDRYSQAIVQWIKTLP